MRVLVTTTRCRSGLSFFGPLDPVVILSISGYGLKFLKSQSEAGTLQKSEFFFFSCLICRYFLLQRLSSSNVRIEEKYDKNK